MNIRKATMKDRKAITELNKKGFRYEFDLFDKTLDMDWPDKNAEYYQNAITNTNCITLVAEVEKKVVGYLIGSITETEDYRNFKNVAELDNLFITEDYRSKGVGTQLMQRFFEWAKSKKMKRTKVRVSFANEKAIRAYEKNGFKGYDIIMERNL